MGLGIPVQNRPGLTLRRPEGHTDPVCPCQPCAAFWDAALGVALSVEKTGRFELYQEQSRLVPPEQRLPYSWIAKGLEAGAARETLLRHFRRFAKEATERGYRPPLPPGTPAELPRHVQGWIFECAVAAAREEFGLESAGRKLTSAELAIMQGRVRRLEDLAAAEILPPHLQDLCRQLAALSHERWLAQREATAQGKLVLA